MLDNCKELYNTKEGRADNCEFELESCNCDVDSDFKFSQAWLEYRKQLWLLFKEDCNSVNSTNDTHSMNCNNTSQVMHVCDSVLGNQFYGIVGDDPDNG